MSMKANVLRDANGNIIVHMQGDLNYDHGVPLRKELEQLVLANPNSDITIDMGAIDFVGSSGICHFVETVRYLKENSKRYVGLSNVRPEFLKIFRLFNMNEAEYVAELMDFDTDHTEVGHKRGKTFEN